jgi:hypothetical protein
MTNVGSIEADLVINDEEFTAGLNQAEQSIKEFAGSAEQAAGKVSGSADRMAGDVKQSADGISASTDKAAKDVDQSSGKMADSMEGSGGRMTKATDTAGFSMKTFGLGMSQTATSAFALYQSVDNIEKKNYALEKATLAAQRADLAAADAQQAYDAAVVKFGSDSPQAEEALNKLNIAKDAAALADERVQLSQNSVNDSMMMAGLTIIPSVISGVDGMVKVWGSMKNLDIVGHVKGIGEAMSSHRGSIVSYGAGLGAIAVIYGAFTTKSGETRAALSLLAGGLVAAAAAQWVFNAAAAFGIGLTGAGLALVAIAAAAAAAVYLLSNQYGASTDVAPEATQNYAGTATGGASSAGGRIASGGGGGTTGGTGGGIGGGGGGGAVGPSGYKSGDVILQQVRPGVYSAFGSPNVLYTGEQVSMILNGRTWDDYSFMVNQILINPDTSEPRYHSDDSGNIIFNGYAMSGWAMRPQLATLAENGPEVILNDSKLDELASRLGGGGGNTYIFNVDGARDVDVVVAEIARKLRNEGGFR